MQQQLAHPAPVTALAWSPESERIITGAANQVTFLTARTGTILASRAQPHTATITALAWTGHNQLQAASGALDHRAITWRTTDYTPQTIFTRHTTPIEAFPGLQMARLSRPARTVGLYVCGMRKTGRKRTLSFKMGRSPCVRSLLLLQVPHSLSEAMTVSRACGRMACSAR